MKKKLPQDPLPVTINQSQSKKPYLKGRGAQMNTPNRFTKTELRQDDPECIDDWEQPDPATTYIEQQARSIVNKVDSPDVGMAYSMNPYAGCEHGCIYCYARNAHEYWGYSAGLDFERKVIVKLNAPLLLRKQLMHPKWEVMPIMLSGNTDCYQPAERKYRLTRRLLEVCRDFNQPVGILTKNAAILKDQDILQELASRKLVRAMVSITSFNEGLRSVMEPRTTTATQRLRVIEQLSNAGVPMGVMLGPMIPGLNDHEIPRIMQAAADAGARFSAYTFIRLNGAIKLLFRDWLYTNFPDRANRVWHLIEQSHKGQVNDSRWGLRMRGEGPVAAMVAAQYAQYGKMYQLDGERVPLDRTIFQRPGQQGLLF
ncbi:PA0069 family radical SAM protein [Niabella terrae]